jgi:hypothetical protein
VDAVLTKISIEYKLKLDDLKNIIGGVSLSDDIDTSIISYCSSLLTEKEKPKRVLKKKAPTAEPAAANVEPVAPTLEPAVPNVEPVVPTLEPAAPTLEPAARNVEPVAPTVEEKPKKILKKKVAVSTEETTVVPPVEDKPKKVLKKKVAVEATPVEPTVIAEDKQKEVDSKPKKIIKKRVTVDATEVPEVKNIDTPEEEVKITPKKIIKKKPSEPTVNEGLPKKQSKKNIDVAEYGVEGNESHDIYEAAELYEDDSVEPREIGGVKYYIDTSNYVYHFESMDLIGKLNESDPTKIIFLADFTSSDEETLTN